MNTTPLIILASIVIVYILFSVKTERLSPKTSFGWMLASVAILFLAIFPHSIDWLATSLGIEYPPALFLTLCIVLLLIINFGHSKKIANLQTKVTDLAEQVSILKAKKK